MGSVLSFLQRVRPSEDWSQQELAEFYRVESALLQAGFAVTTERGVSDEGEPWFVFCRADNDEVIGHFARIDNEYVIVSNFYRGTLRGRDFRALVRRMLDSHPMMLTVRRRHGQNVFLHPAALVAALIASAYVISSEKALASEKHSADGHSKNASLISQLMGKFSIFAAAAFAGAAWIDHHANALLQFFDNHLLVHQHSYENVAHGTGPVGSALYAVLQTIHDLELAAYKLAANDANAAAPHDGQVLAKAAIVSGHIPSLSIAADKIGDAGQPTGSESFANVQLADGPHSDNSTNSNSGHITLVAQTESIAVSPQLMAGESFAAMASATSSEAYHLAALETGSLSTVVLSTSGGSVGQALQQSFQQVGLDPGLLNGPDAVGTSDADSSKPDVPAGSSGTSVHSDVGTPTGQSSNTTSAANANLATNANPAANTNSATNDNISTNAGFTMNADGGQSNHITVTNVPLSAEAQVTQTVEAFLSSTPSAEVTVSGANVVIIDTNLADASSTHFGVLTWDMSDGSTLSIVGILPSHYQLAA